MELDDIFEQMRASGGVSALDGDAIIAAAFERRATRLSPAMLASAGALSLVVGLGAGLGSAQPASASPTLVPFAYSPSNVLLGD